MKRKTTALPLLFNNLKKTTGGSNTAQSLTMHGKPWAEAIDRADFRPLIVRRKKSGRRSSSAAAQPNRKEDYQLWKASTS